MAEISSWTWSFLSFIINTVRFLIDCALRLRRCLLSVFLKSSTNRLSLYYKGFLKDLDPKDIQDKAHILGIQSDVIPGDLTKIADLFHELIFEETFIIPSEIWFSWDWLVFKEMKVMKPIKKKVHIFDTQLGDSGGFKVVVVGFKDDVYQVRQKILDFLNNQSTTSKLVLFGKGKNELLSFFLQMPQLSKPMVLAEGLSLIYKVCESGIEITGTNANVQRATREIQKEISKRSAHSQSKNSGIKTSVEPFKNFKVVVCSGYDNTIHLSSESLIVQNSGHEILFDGKDPGVVAGELSEITLTVKEGLSKLGKLQSVIRLHWQCKSIKNNHTEVLEAAVIKALEYVKTQGQTSVSIYCPLDKDLNTSIQAATVAAALEGFCKAQSYLFVSALSVFIVCPNETEWANIMKKNLEIVWACSNSKQNGMQEVIPVIPQNISVRLVSGTLEENQVQAIVVPVTVSARTNSIKLSSLCTHKPSCNLEELLQIQSSCLVDKLLKGQIIPVTCRGSGLLCEYLYLMEVQDDWRDPVEKLRGLMYKFATLSHRLLLTSLAVPVLDLSRHKVQSSQVVKWLLEGLKMFERETSFSWLHSVWLVLSPDCTDFSLVKQGINRSEEPLGICFADHPFFIQYLQDSKQAFMEISLKLKKTSSSFSIFKMSKKCCLSVSPRGYVSGGMSLSKWKTEQGKVYNSLRSRYSVKSHYIPNLTQVEKYEPALKKLQSVKVSEHERCVVGLTEEVNKYIQIADLNRHVKETFSNKIWGDLSEKAIQHVAKDLQLELVTHFPGVIALQDKMKPPNTIFQGPYKSMYSAIDVFMKLISKALLCVFLSDKLSDYKCSFLKSWNLSVLSQTLFHARNIRATLKVQHSCLIIQGGSFEDNQRAMEVLNDDIYETEIRISHASQASTMGVKWSKQLKDISYTFNKSQKKVEIHTIPHEDNINIKVLLVGFKTEVHAAKCILDQYFHDNTDIKGIVEFKQPHLVEASHRIVEIIEEKNLLGVKLEVNIYTNSKVEIILTGPRSEVHKAQEILKRDLNSVVVKSMKIEGLGAAHYFQDPKTTEILKAVGSAYFCIITVRTQQSIAPRRLEDEKNHPLGEIYKGLTEPAEIFLMGRPVNVDNAVKALPSHFRDCHTAKFICDSRIEKLTPDELHAVTKDLGIMLHRGDGGLSLEGLKTHVDEAQTRLEDILKTKDTILNAGFGQMNDILQMTPCFQNSAVLWNARADLPFYPVTEYTLPSPSSLYSSFLCHYPDTCRSFNTTDGLQSHYWQMHTPEGTAKCSKCGKESTKSGIIQHEKTCMGNSFSYIPKATPSPNIQSMQHDSGLGTVSDGLSFITPNISTPVTPFDNLGFDLKPKSLFYNSTFHSDPVIEYTLPISSSLQSSFLCQYPDCCRSFDTSNGLQSHYRQMHTPEESAKCSKCGKESTKSGITQHEKTCMGNSFSSIPKATPSPILQSMQHDSGLGTVSDGLSFITPNISTPVTPVGNLGFDLKPKSLFYNSAFHSDPVTEYSLPIPSSLQSSFLCRYPDCCRSFDTSNGLQSHYRQMHTPEGRAKCSKCGKESTKSGITQHEKTCMGNSFSYIPKATPSPNIQSMQHDSGLGTVSDGLSFITPNISTPVTPVDNLGFDLKPKSLFYNSAFHSDAVTEYTLPISSSLQSSFLCQYPDCCRSFDTSNGLQSHYRQMHTPEESAKCSKCGKESTKSGITQHEKTCMGNSFSSIPKATPSPILQSMQHDSGLGTMSDRLSFITPISFGILGFDLKPKSLFNNSTFHSGIKQSNTISYTPTYTKAFACFCGRSFDTQRGLSSHHTQIHTASGRARCYICGLESTKSGITRHKCKKR
ncbi:uncharacterized protein LOC120523783 [Polypterus senegalus]|uniref:uncharacterized protein LOC120523783 n=1 Tax=Polypterus senegalus TaxID=55291 RepID=UPI001964F1F7|nr:uncharacterized protein LOC120523783 [Polypterus senegalus]